MVLGLVALLAETLEVVKVVSQGVAPLSADYTHKALEVMYIRRLLDHTTTQA